MKKSRQTSRVLSTSIASFLAAAAALTPARAATIYWDGSGTLWSAAASWSTSSGLPTPDQLPLGTDIAQFNISSVNTAQTVSLNANQTIAGLIFSSTGTTLLQGGGTNRTLTLGGSGIVVNSGAGAATVGSATANQNVSVTMSAAQAWTNNSTNLLSVVNTVANGGFLLTSTGTGNTTIAAVISGGGGLTKTGAGTLTLSGANTFTGTTTISAGIVRATTSAAALGAGALSLGSGTLQLANNSALNFGRATTVTANTTMVSDRLSAGAGLTHTLGTLSIGAQTLSTTRGALATSGTGGITFGTTTMTAVGSTFDPQANSTLTLGSVHGGAFGITKIGAGTLVLSGASTHTGDTTVSSGVLQLNNNTAAGNGAIFIAPAAATANRVLINGGVTVANAISFGNTLGAVGTGVIQQTGTGQGTYAGPITITGAPSAGGHFVGGAAIGNELVLAGPISSTVSLSQRAGRIIYKGGGTVTAAGTPTLTVTDVALIGATNGMPTMLTPSLGGSGNATLDLNGFDQQLSGLILGNAGLAFIGTVNVGTKTLSLTGNVTTQTPGGVTGAHTINATGGTLALGGATRTFTVSNSLSADDLAVNGGTITGTGGIVKEGPGTLALNGVAIAGPLTINDGALQTGNLGLVGSFSSSALIFGPNPTTLQMKLGATSDLITTGPLVTNGSTTVNLSQSGGALPLGTKTLINYTGASPGLGGFALGVLPGRLVGALADTGTSITFTTTANDQIVWSGANGSTWSEGGTGNWKLLSTLAPNDYLAGDVVSFPDNPATNLVTIDTNVAPSHVTFTNTIAGATDYTVTGSAGITGGTSLVKAGDGAVTLINPNSYAGATTVSAGTLELDHDAPTNVVLSATSGVSVANVATLKLTRDDGAFTFNRNISGAGIVEINPHSIASGLGALALTLSGNNTGFTGLLTLAAPLSGTYRLTNVAPSALGSAAIDVQSGAQLYTANGQTYPNSIVIAGSGYADAGTGVSGNIGALRLETGSNWAGPVTVNGIARIGAHNGTGTVSGPISGGDLEVNISNYNSNYTVILTGTNSYGTTTLGGGNSQGTVFTMRLNIGNGGTTGSLGTGSVALNGDGANGVLGFDRSNGYTLLPGQNIIGGGSNVARTFIDFDTLGAGFNDNGNTIALGSAAPVSGGNFRIGQARANAVATFSGTAVSERTTVSSAQSGATMNINPGANLSTNFFTMGETAGATGGVVNQNGGNVSVLGQVRVGHFGTETSTYNLNNGTLTLTGASPTLTPSTAGAGAANATGDNNIDGGATATIHGGGVYLGIDGTGIFNHNGGTLTTNWIVLDNRGDTAGGTNMVSGIDRYNLSGAGSVLALRSTYGLIARNTSTAVSFGGGTVGVDNTGTGTGTGANLTIPLDATIDTVAATTTNLNTNGAGNALTLLRDVRGSGTLNLTGGGTVNVTTAGQQVVSANLSGNTQLTKLGNGTTSLTGSGAGYTSVVNITAGQLNVPNDLAATSITLADATVLGGEPSVGNVTIGTSVRADVVFNPNTAGALTAGTLAVNAASGILSFSETPTGAGPWTAINYTTKSGPGSFGLLNSGSYRVAPAVTDTGSSITVNVTGTKALTWTGAGAVTNLWDNNVNANWANTTPAPDNFFAGDTVTFGDGPGVVVVTVTSGVSPWKTTIISDTNNYNLISTVNGIAGPGSLEKTGVSTLTLTGPNSYSGRTLVGGGTVSFATATSLGSGAVGNSLTISGGGRLSYNASIALDLGVNRSIAIGTGGGSISHNNATAVGLSIPGNITGTDPLSFHSNAAGAGTFILTGNNAGYNGNITVDAPTSGSGGLTSLRLATQSAVPAGGSITLNYPAAATTNGNATTLDLFGVTLPGSLTINLTSLLNGAISQRSQIVSPGTSVINGPITLAGNSVTQISPTGTISLNGPVTDNGYSGTFFLRGTGTVIVNNTINLPNATLSHTDTGLGILNSTGNSWAATSIVVGTLRTGIADALPANASLVLGQNDTNTAVLDLNGFNQTTSSLTSNPVIANANSVGKAITSATPATFTLAQFTNTTYAGLLTGELILKKEGSGRLTLLGTNSYNGLTSISDGVLNLQNRSALGSIANGTTVASGATLELQANISVGAEALSINGTGSFLSNGALASVSGTNSYGGLVTIATNATIAAASGAVLNLNGGVDKSGTTVTFTGGGSININYVPVTGAAAGSDLIVDGVGLGLNIASTYNGPTIVRGGGLLISGADQAVPNVSKVTLGDSATNTDGTWFLSGKTQTIAGLASAGSGAKSITLGGGALTVDQAANSIYDGSLTGLGLFEKKGGGKLALTGLVDVPTVTVNDGTLDLYTAVGTGTSTVNANDLVNFGTSQTLGALNIGDGGVATLGTLPPPSPAVAFTPEALGGDIAGSPVQPVPEPGSAALLLGGITMLLGLRRRRA